MSVIKKSLAFFILSSLMATPATLAATFDIDVSGISSVDAFGSSANDVLVIDLADALGFSSGTALTVSGIGWDVVIESFGFSWLSEITAAFTNSDGTDGLDLSPGAGNDFPGMPTAFTSGGVLDLGAIDPTFPFDLPDGVLMIEFYESFDDAAGVIDGAWVSGILTIDAIEAAPIPVPAALPLLLSALGIIGLSARRPA